MKNVIPFEMFHWFEPDTSLVENAHALRALLDCLIDLNASYLKYHPNTPKLYQSGVRYERVNEWLPIPALYNLGVGDCKSLACALIAEYRKAGIPCEPAFRWVVRKGEPKVVRDFHILVEVETGWEDPSKVLGMGADEVAPLNEPQSLVGVDSRKVRDNLRKLKIF